MLSQQRAGQAGRFGEAAVFQGIQPPCLLLAGYRPDLNLLDLVYVFEIKMDHNPEGIPFLPGNLAGAHCVI